MVAHAVNSCVSVMCIWLRDCTARACDGIANPFIALLSIVSACVNVRHFHGGLLIKCTGKI